MRPIYVLPPPPPMYFSPPSFYSPPPPLYAPTPVDSAPVYVAPPPPPVVAPSNPIYAPTPVDSDPVYKATTPPPVVVVRERSDAFADGLRTGAVVAVVVSSPLWVPPLVDAFKGGGDLYSADQAEYGGGDGGNARDGEVTLVRLNTSYRILTVAIPNKVPL